MLYFKAIFQFAVKIDKTGTQHQRRGTDYRVRIGIEKAGITRRMLLMGGVTVLLAVFNHGPAHAKDGGSGDSDSDGHSGDHSGKDGDGDDDDDSNKRKNQLDSDRIQDAVESGRAISLSAAMDILDKTKTGRIIDVRLVNMGSALAYQFKMISENGKVKTVSMDAKTGHIRNWLGF
jgi:hypothetical protein